jgi:hypothetical protein
MDANPTLLIPSQLDLTLQVWNGPDEQVVATIAPLFSLAASAGTSRSLRSTLAASLSDSQQEFARGHWDNRSAGRGIPRGKHARWEPPDRWRRALADDIACAPCLPRPAVGATSTYQPPSPSSRSPRPERRLPQPHLAPHSVQASWGNQIELSASILSCQLLSSALASLTRQVLAFEATMRPRPTIVTDRSPASTSTSVWPRPRTSANPLHGSSRISAGTLKRRTGLSSTTPPALNPH